ncbi:ankyrin repeat domain-containing protein [Kangiella sp. M94]
MNKIQKLIMNAEFKKLEQLFIESPDLLHSLSFENVIRLIGEGYKGTIIYYLPKLLPSSLIDEDGFTLAHFASKTKDIELLDALVNSGYSINAQDEEGITPLMIAARFGDYNLFKYFITKNCSPFLLSNDGNTLLHHSIIYFDQPQIVHKLLALGVDPKTKNKLGLNALEYASLLNRKLAHRLMSNHE